MECPYCKSKTIYKADYVSKILKGIIKMTFVLVPIYLGILLNQMWLEVIGIGILAGLVTE